MPINSKTATANPDQCRLDKSNARTFSVTVANQTVSCQINVAPFGRGESWMPVQGINIVPGFWNLNERDWEEYGVKVAQGIRFTSVDITDPGVVSVS